MTTTEYAVTGMTCAHCEAAVQQEVGELPGIQNIDVEASTGRLVITSDAVLDDAAVFAAVDEAGYSAVRS
jgi:copper chaperone